MKDGDDSFANAVEYVAKQLGHWAQLPAHARIDEASAKLMQLVSNYRRRAAAALNAAPPAELCFRIFRRCDATLPGGELGAAVWFCSSDTPDTFGVVVGADVAEHFEEGARFVLVPAPKR